MHRRLGRDGDNDQPDAEALELFAEVYDGFKRLLGVFGGIAGKQVLDFGRQKSPPFHAFDC